MSAGSLSEVNVMSKQIMSKQKAIDKLRVSREISTDLLAPLGISLDGFLHYAQLSRENAESIVDALIRSWDNEQQSK